MENIQDMIKKIDQFFKGMQVTDVEGTNVIYVSVVFPERWVIDSSITDKYEVSVIDGQGQDELLFCADINTGFDKVFDAIDFCIQVNKDAMERTKIFQEKLTKLKEIYQENLTKLKEMFSNMEYSIEDLKSLEYTTLELTIAKKKKTQQKKKTQIEEIAEQEMNKEE